MINKSLIVTDQNAKKRIDQLLAGEFDNLSRNQIIKIINNKLVKVNNKSIKPSYKVKTGDDVCITLADDTNRIELKPENIFLNMIYEDDDVIVINKPANMVVHPGEGNKSGTLVNALINYYPDITNAVFDDRSEISRLRPGIVHRLDKNTTGIMVVAKNKKALNFLKNEIQNRKVEKKYLALCLDSFSNSEDTVENYIVRHPKDKVKMSVSKEDKGKKAITKYKVLNTYKFDIYDISLVEFQIFTGRTHQIRVHAKELNSPVLGDQTYYNKKSNEVSNKLSINRPMLHSKSIKIKLPSGKIHFFNAPTPEDINDLLKRIK